MIKLSKVQNAILAIAGIAFVLGLAVLPSPVVLHADALSLASQATIIATTTDAIDANIEQNFPTTLLWTVGIVLLFLFVGVVLSYLHWGPRTIRKSR